MTIHELAVRIDELDENTLKTFSQLFVDDQCKYVISREVAKLTKKIHFHAYCLYENHKGYKYTSNLLRKKFLKAFPDVLGYQYCIQKVKDAKDYLVYMTKDLDIKSSAGFEEEELKQIVKKTTQINDEKKKKMKQQLVDYIFGKEYTIQPTYRDIMKDIILYHVNRDYLPPTPTMLYQYTCYVMIKLNYDTTEFYSAKLGI